MSDARAPSARLAWSAVAAAAGFAAVAGGVASGRLDRFDAAAHGAVFPLFASDLGLATVVTWLGNNDTVVVLVVLVAGALLLARRPWLAARVVTASAVGGIVVRSLKALFGRDRPLDRLVPAEGWSFPSGHAFASTVFYGMMIYVVWRLTERAGLRLAAAVVFPLVFVAVGLSRVALGVHYASDVAAGWLAGGAWLLAVLAVARAAEYWARRGALERRAARRAR